MNLSEGFARVAAHTGPLGCADAGFVKVVTGFSIGGVALLAHATPPVADVVQA